MQSSAKKACLNYVNSILVSSKDYATLEGKKINDEMCKAYPKDQENCQSICDSFVKEYPAPVSALACTGLPISFKEECLRRLPPIGGNEDINLDDLEELQPTSEPAESDGRDENEIILPPLEPPLVRPTEEGRPGTIFPQFSID